MSRSILVILPTYNERENLKKLVHEIRDLKIEGLEILVVDDQSPDGTWAVADQLASDFKDVHVIHRKPPRGRGLAGIEGFIWARDQGYDLTFEMDADFSHPPRFIPELLAPFNEDSGLDLVIGSRYIPGGKIEGWPMWRHWNSAVANRMAKTVLGLSPKDCTSGYRCFSKRALAALAWERMIATGPVIVEEILYHFEKSDLRFKEVPITFVERVEGVSKVNVGTILRWIKELGRIKKNYRNA
ncbi:MAG: polyprenol monophosphomannose synthase [Candidatus Omnitrophica bacterium]|nr:polyprenol monophosphomannose synthase [Candidatus Omnitrophota bacterium]